MLAVDFIEEVQTMARERGVELLALEVRHVKPDVLISASVGLAEVGGVEWCTVHHGVVDECGPDRTVQVDIVDGEHDELYEFTACDLYDLESECNVVPLFHHIPVVDVAGSEGPTPDEVQP